MTAPLAPLDALEAEPADMGPAPKYARLPGTALMCRPECQHGHGPMVLREPRTYTQEQAWCGTWYDCAPGPWSCKSSVLFPSPALDASSRAVSR